MFYKGLIEKYREYLPVTEKTPMLTLYEGNTPLVEAKHLSEILGLELYLKYEGMNPTGSFKDRGMVMAVAKALEDGSDTLICASTGNTSAAASAYAAKSGIKSIIVIPGGNIALGKLAQAIAYGAEVVSIKGNFDRALDIVLELSRNEEYTLVNSLNPFRIEGQKTAAFEIIDRLGDAPDYLAIPVGNAGNITAYARGFREYYAANKSKQMPKILGFEAEGAAAITTGKPIEFPETIATAIRIGNPASWEGAINAAKDTNGLIDSVTDEEILAAYKLLAKTEGVFAEPASAASIAGIIKKKEAGYFAGGERVVAVLTGHGLKDPNVAIKIIDKEIVEIDSDYDAVLRAIKS